MTTLLERASAFAKKNHGGRMYSDKPYIYHLENVARLLKNSGYSEEYQAIGLLHDILEDTTVLVDELQSEFGNHIGRTVLTLTRRNGETYKEYIERVSLDPYAVPIKVCDLLTNLEHAIEYGKDEVIKRYQKALLYLATKK